MNPILTVLLVDNEEENNIMKKIFLIGCLALLNFSCTNDNDDKLTFDFEGPWTLFNVSCFCDFGGDTDFSTHKITFDAEEVIIENSGQNEFLTNAEGAYTVTDSIITFNNGEQYKIEVKLDRLYLIFEDDPEVADDELTLEYFRG